MTDCGWWPRRERERIGILYPTMISPTTSQRNAWMMQWRSAAIELERVRLSELDSVDLARVALDLEDSCVVSALAARDSQESGLIEQQRWLHRHRRT